MRNLVNLWLKRHMFSVFSVQFAPILLVLLVVVVVVAVQ